MCVCVCVQESEGESGVRVVFCVSQASWGSARACGSQGWELPWHMGARSKWLVLGAVTTRLSCHI